MSTFVDPVRAFEGEEVEGSAEEGLPIVGLRSHGATSEITRDGVSPRQQLPPAGLKVDRKDIEGESLQALGHVRLDELLPLP